MDAHSGLTAATIRDLDPEEVLQIAGASIGEALGAGVAGVGTVRTVAAIAGATLGPEATAGLVIGGFLAGVAVYYLTD